MFNWCSNVPHPHYSITCIKMLIPTSYQLDKDYCGPCNVPLSTYCNVLLQSIYVCVKYNFPLKVFPSVFWRVPYIGECEGRLFVCLFVERKFGRNSYCIWEGTLYLQITPPRKEERFHAY